MATFQQGSFQDIALASSADTPYDDLKAELVGKVLFL